MNSIVAISVIESNIINKSFFVLNVVYLQGYSFIYLANMYNPINDIVEYPSWKKSTVLNKKP